MLDRYWRPPLRKLLLNILKWTEKSPMSTAVKRGGKQTFWQQHLHLPNWLISIVSLTVIFAVLILDIGFIWPKIAGLALFLLLSFVFLTVYLNDDYPELVDDSEAMALLGLIMILSVLLMLLFKNLVWLERSMAMATPMAASSILIGLMLSRQISIVTTVILSMILASINGFNLIYFLVHLFGSLAAIAGIPSARNRSDLTQLGLRVSVVNIIGIATVWLFTKWISPDITVLGVDILWGALSGLGSVIIVLATLPYLEAFFSRTTNIKLLELADFNRPLLRRLMIEAPGTYHHSLIVSSLAEQAAEAIGSNSLLARVISYYHDIGKLAKPEYFIENQQATINPHDPLTPTMSSLILISHVKEGVALARTRKLDRVIIDGIEQHHGDSLIHYFYHRALEQKAEIKPENFRYPGPKPKSKEMAILMLADAVEAASRALEDPSPSRLRDSVKKIINNKFTDGQFTDCPITLHDLNTIADSMAATLNGIFHLRVEYQDTAETAGLIKEKTQKAPAPAESKELLTYESKKGKTETKKSKS